jgi:hypothetical protein
MPQEFLDMAQPEDILLMDVAHGMTSVPVKPIRQIVAASPGTLREELVRTWTKQIKLIKRYFPALEKQQVNEMRRLRHPTEEEQKLDRDTPTERRVLGGECMAAPMTSAELNNRFDEFGGIPRSLFHLSQKELNDRLKQSLSETKLKDIVEKVSLADGQVRLEKTSSMLLHYDVFVSPPLQPDHCFHPN